MNNEGFQLEWINISSIYDANFDLIISVKKLSIRKKKFTNSSQQ